MIIDYVEKREGKGIIENGRMRPTGVFPGEKMENGDKIRTSSEYSWRLLFFLSVMVVLDFHFCFTIATVYVREKLH